MLRPALLLAVGLPALLLLAPTRAADPEPSPGLAPSEVVRIQLEALQTNDDPYDDAGIATVFRFASPGNRAATGPLERFTAMVHGPAYRDMLGFRRALYGAMRVEGDRAVQSVTLVHEDGRRVSYVFGLSRQTGGACDGCWMTDAVVREPEPAEPPSRKV